MKAYVVTRTDLHTSEMTVDSVHRCNPKGVHRLQTYVNNRNWYSGKNQAGLYGFELKGPFEVL